MSSNKTIATTASAQEFLDTVENETRRVDSFALVEFFQKITVHPQVLWGNSLVGFGSYYYIYDNGREGDMPIAGFSPRKQNIAIYNTGLNRCPEQLNRLGKFKTDKSCLYINKL